LANTRFNPTANGNLHLGHLFTLLVNEHVAHTTGGKFYVRFDDKNDLIAHFSPHKLKCITQSQMDDIKWLGVEVDGWSWQSQILPDVRAKIKKSGHKTFPDSLPGYHKIPLVVRMGADFISYPYVSQQTAERVIMDSILNITHVIRGDDFLTEYCLYYYFCQLFELPTPNFIFLPRLSSINGDISKSVGGYKVASFRQEGHTSEEIKRLVREACVYDPNLTWDLYNIKSNPRLNI
jgi:glutamyl/glutaminyl-tRNA synthetase